MGERVVKYIPTHLDYVAGKDDIERMVNKIQGLKQEDLGSLFYDPYIEFCDITLSPQPDGYPAYQYADSSGLHKIINALIHKGYRFVTIKDF